MQELKIRSYQPHSMLMVYEAVNPVMSDKYYLESAVIKNKNGKIEPGPFAPVSINLLKKITEAISKNLNVFEFDGLTQNNIIRFAVVGSNAKVVWMVEPSKRFLYFTEEMGIENGDYPLPRLIFSLDENELSVFAVKSNESVSSDSILYSAPFGNIGSNGSVCMGNVKISKKMTSIHTITETWERLFFNSYFTHTNNEKIIKGNLVALFKSLKDQNVFPDDVLVPTQYKLSKLLK